MVKQSKNKVKLNKEYKVIGRIPIAAIRKIKEVMELPGNVQTIRANIGNTLKHNHRHVEEIEDVAAVHLHYQKNENFWLVTTVHTMKPHDLQKIPLIWKK